MGFQLSHGQFCALLATAVCTISGQLIPSLFLYFKIPLSQSLLKSWLSPNFLEWGIKKQENCYSYFLSSLWDRFRSNSIGTNPTNNQRVPRRPRWYGHTRFLSPVFSIPPGWGPHQPLNNSIAILVTSDALRALQMLQFSSFPLCLFSWVFFLSSKTFGPIKDWAHKREKIWDMSASLRPLCIAQDCVIWYLQRNPFRKLVPGWCEVTWTLDQHAVC